MEFASADLTVGEGDGDVSVEIRLAGGTLVGPATVIPLVMTDDSALAGTHYTTVTSGTISAGGNSVSVDISITDDAVDNTDRTFTVSLGTPLPMDITPGTITETTISITDDDDPLTVQFSSATAMVAEDAGTVELTLQLSEAATEQIIVPIMTTSGTATSGAGNDYTALAADATVTFAINDTEQTISVTILDDVAAEGNETFTLSFSPGALPSGVTAGTPTTVTVTVVDDDVPVVSFTGAAARTVAEGAGTVTLTVALSAALTTPLTVPVMTANDTATAGSDYTALSGASAMVVFAANATGAGLMQTVNVAILNDTADENDETFTVSLGVLPSTVSGSGTVTVTITDDDVPALSVAADPTTITEGAASTITITADIAPANDLTIPFTIDGTGIAAADYTLTTGSTTLTGLTGNVTLPATQTSVELTLTAVNDADSAETLTYTLNTPVSGAGYTLTTAAATIMIDPAPLPTVQFSAATATVAEDAGMATVTLELSSAATERITFFVGTTGNTATFREDYRSGLMVVFNVNDTMATASVPIVNDALVEPDETFTVALDAGQLPASVVLGAQFQIIVTIDSEDMGSVEFASADLTVGEGDGNVSVEILLSGGTLVGADTVIPLVTGNGTALAGTHYTAVTSGTILAGGNSISVDIPILGDGVDNANRMFTVSLGTPLPTDITPGTVTETTIEIIDDDVPSVMVSFESGTARVGEEAGPLTVTVQLNTSPSDETVVPIVTGDVTAVAGEDYTALAGAAAMVTFASGATGADLMQTVEVAITDDSVSEGNETFTLSFGSLPSGVTAGTPNSVTVTVVDDEVATVSFTGADAVSVAEDAGTVELTVELSETPSGAVQVMLQTADGTASAGSDYTALSGDEAMVTFSAGATGAALSQTVSVAITDDDLDENDEMFTVSLGGLPSGVGGGGTVTVTITDDDTPTVSFTGAAARTVAETVGTVVLTVELDIAPVTTLSIPVMTDDGTATMGEDYVRVSRNVVFAAGTAALMQTVSVAITDDEDDEDDETFTVALGTLPPGVAEGTVPSVTVTITDDDVPMVSFTEVGTVSEAESTVDLQVELDIIPLIALVIPVMTIDGTATAGSDYTALSGATVTFAAGTTTLSQTVTVTLLPDTTSETDETFMAFFGPLPTGVVAGTLNRITVTLVDDDVLRLSVAAFPTSVQEGSASTLTITSTMAAPDDLTIPYTISGAGITDADYTLTDTLGNAVTSPVTLAIGRTSVALTLTAAADADGEETLTYTLTTAAPDAGYTVDTTAAAAAVTITPMAALVVELTADAVTVAEGAGMAAVTARLIGGAPAAELVVPITVTAGTAQEGSDYTDPTTASVTFPMNATGAALTQTVSIPITDDAVYERDERFTVALGVPPGNVSFGAVDSATVTITDNDALTVGLTDATATVGEAGGSVTLTVQVATGTELGTDVAIALVSADGTAQSGLDYTALSGAMVTFAAGATGADLMQTVSVPILQDAANENAETFTVSLGPLPPRATAGPQGSTTVTITDDDALVLSVIAGATEIAEGEATTLTIQTNGVSPSAVSAAFTLSGSTTSADYTLIDASGSAVTSPVMLASGQTSAVLTLTAADDADTSNQTLIFTLAAGAGYTVSTTAPAVMVTITPLLLTAELLPATRRVAENASVSGLLLLTARLNRSPATDVMLNFSARNGTAIAGSDFRLVTTAVQFRAGTSGANLSTSVIVEILNDNLTENDETFTVTMSAGSPSPLDAFGNTETVVTILDDETPAVSFISAQAAVGEADGMVALTLELNSSPSGELVIPVTTTDVTARAGSDYTALSGATVTFASGATGAALRQTVSVPVLADTADEIDETFIVSLGTLPPGVSAGGTSAVTVTITDDDTPTISFASATASISEANGPVSVTVQLDSTPVTPVLVLINTRNGTALAGEDYTALSELVMFAAGATGAALMQTINIEITDGRVYEGVTDETFTVSWGALPSGVTAGTPSAVTVTIEEDDVPNVSMAAATRQVFEGAGTVTVTVQLSDMPRPDLPGREGHVIPSITVTTMDGTAQSPGDYTALSGATVTFPDGATGADLMQTVSIPIIDDDDTENDETFTVLLTQAPGDVTYDGPQMTAVTIIDNDAAMPELLVSLSSSDAAITDPADIYEGESVTLTIEANQASADDLLVSFLVRGVSGADYTLTAADGTAVSSPLTLPSGETSLALTLMAVNDADTVMETLTFLLRDPAVDAGYTRRTDQYSADVVLRPAAELALSASASALAEYRGSVEVTAQWSGGVPSADLIVPLETAGTATRGPDADYELCTREATGTDCTDLVFSVAFATGGGASQSRVVPVSTRDDILTEGDETLTLSLDTAGLPTRGLILGRTSVTLTITEGAEPVLSLGAGLTTRVNEEARTLSVPLEYTGAAVDQVTVPFSVTAGSATAGSDYRPPAETTVILNATPGQAGSVSRAVALIDILADDVNEGDETFTIEWGGVSQQITIADNDDPVVSFASPLRPLVTEGDGPLVLVVQLDQAPLTDLVVPLVVTGDGSAQAATAVSDYVLAATSVTFAAGATGADLMQTVNVTIVDDGQIELQEVFTVAFGELPGDVTADPAASRVTVAINSNNAPVLEITTDQPTATLDIRENQFVTFTIRSTNGVPLGDVRGSYTLTEAPDKMGFDDADSGGGRFGDVALIASNGNELGGGEAFVLLAAGQTSSTFRLRALPDKDDVEIAQFNFNAIPTGAATFAAGSNVRILIIRPEVPMLVEFVPAFLEVDENAGSVSGLSARLDVSPIADVTVPLSTVGADTPTPGVATAGTDYTLTTTSVTFAAGATGDDLTQAVTLAITEDDLAEGQESFQVVFDTSHATYPAGLTAGRAAFVAITDNEAPGLWVSAFKNSIAEAETTTITIRSTERLTANLTVPFTLSGTATRGTGSTPAEDYTLTDRNGDDVTSPLTFASGQRSLTLTLRSFNDGDPTSETVIFTLTAPVDDTAGYTVRTNAVTSGTTTVTIVPLLPAVTFPNRTERRISEGTATFQINVLLNESPSSGITVPITAIGDTATAGEDYTLTTTSVTFDARATGSALTRTVTVAIIDDDVYEGDETFTLSFGDLTSAGVITGAVSRVEVTIAENETLEAGFLAGTATVNEGDGTVDLMFRLSGPVAANTVFPLVIAAGGSAERNRDYRLDATGITFVAGATGNALTQTLSIPVLDDSIDEVDEMFTISLDTAALPPGVTVPAATAFTGFAGVTVTVNDNDVPAVSVSALPGSVSEGETSTITVSSDIEPATALTIPFTIAGTGITDADYRLTDAGGTPVASTLTLAAGSRSTLLTLTTLIDEADTASETLTWTLDTPVSDAGYTVGAPGAASVEITSGTVAIAVEFASDVTVAEADEEATVTVRLNTVPSSSITVPIVTAGTATAGEDYTAVSSVTFAPGAIMHTFSITILNDILVETDETFTVSFGDLTAIGLVAGTRSSMTVTITSEDIPILEISPTGDTLTVTEGESIPITIRSINGVLPFDQLITISTNSGSSGFFHFQEFNLFNPGGARIEPSGIRGVYRFILQAGGEEWTHMLMAVRDGDSRVESGNVRLFIDPRDDRHAVFTLKTYRLTINPVGTVLPALSVAADPTAITEGTASTITITTTSALADDLILPYTIGGTGITTGDYTLTGATDVTGLTGNVTLPSGDTSVELTLTAMNDAADVAAEMLTFTLAAPMPGAAYTVTTSTATITINPVAAGTLTVQFSEATLDVTEGTDDTATVTLQLSAEAIEEIVVPIMTMDGTASAGSDYTALTQDVTFAIGEMSQDISIAITDDSLVEPDQTFTVSLGTLPSGLPAGSTTSVEVTIDSEDTAVVRFLLSRSTRSEGDRGRVQVSLTNSVQPATEIPLVFTDGTAMDGVHYTAVASVTVPSGARIGTLLVPTVDDAVDNPDRMFTVSLGTPLPPDITSGGGSQTVVIADNDDPLPALSVAADPTAITEGAASTITITVNSALSNNLTIPYTIAGTNITAADYTLTTGATTLTGLTGNVTLPANQTSVALTLTAADDADVAAEMLTFTLNTPAPGAVYMVATSTATVTINPIVVATVPTVEFSAATLDVNESAGTATVTVRLSEAATEEIVVPIMTANGTATSGAGNDYTALAADATVTFAINDTEQTISVTILDDALVEPAETFTVSFGDLSALSNVTAGAQTSTTVTITSEDVPVLERVAPAPGGNGNYTLAAGESISITFRSTNGTPPNDIGVTFYEVGFSGDTRVLDTSGNVATGGSFNLPGGVDSWTYTVMALDDGDTEVETGQVVQEFYYNVTTFLSFYGPMVTINPPAPPPALSVAAVPTTIREGAASTITITASTAPANDLTIPYTIAGTDITAADYTLTAGATTLAGLTGEVTLPATQTSVELTLTAADDADTDPEMLTFTLDTPGGTAGYTVTTGTATITIEQAAASTGLTVEFSTASISFNELSADNNATNRVTFNVVLSGLLRGGATVEIPVMTTAGTATADTDYTSLSTMLTFTAGSPPSQEVSIEIASDDLYETDETFTVIFGDLAGSGVTAGTVSVVTVTIDDDDTLTVDFAGGIIQRVNENAGPLEITMRLSAAPGADVSIPYNVNATSATLGDDFGTPNGILTGNSAEFTAGNREAVLSFPIEHDMTDEINNIETFQVNFTGVMLPPRVQARASSGGTVVSSIQIIDENPALSISAAHSDIGSGRTSTEITIEVTNGITLQAALQIPFTISGLATRVGRTPDYTLTDVASDTALPLRETSVALAPGATIRWRMDLIVDADSRSENAVFTLTTPGSNAGYTVATSTATVTIRQLRSVEFSAAAISVNEGSTVTVSITGSGSQIDPAVDYMIPIIIAGGTATDGADYPTLSRAVTLSSGDTSGSVSISITDDAVYEGDETLILSLGDALAATGIYTGSISSTTVTITDNDALIVSFANTALTLPEDAGTVNVEMRLDSAPAIPVTLQVSALPSIPAATLGTDYSIPNTSVTFNAGTTTAMVALSITEDNIVEENEVFELFLENPPARVTLDEIAVVTITDNDVPTVQFAEPNLDVAENVGTVTVTVELNSPADGAISIPIMTEDDTAMAGSDYTAVMTDVDIADGATTGSVTIAITNDNTREASEESFTVSFGTLPVSVMAGAARNQRLTVVIRDDDALTIAGFSAAAISVDEDAGTLTVAVDVSQAGGAGLPAPLDLRYIWTAGTASAFVDFDPIPVGLRRDVPLNTGATGFIVRATIIDNDMVEGNKTMSLRLLAPGATGVDITIPAVTITIIDDDGAALGLSVAAAPTAIAEGATSTITITANSAPANRLTIPYTIGGTGITAADYMLTAGGSTLAGLAGNISLPSGSTSVELTLTAADDADVAAEMLTFTLDAPANAAGYTLRAMNTATITINPIGAATVPTVEFSEATLDVDEDADTVTVTVELSEAATEQIIVPVVTMDGTGPAAARAGDDYTALSSGTVTFAIGDMSKDISIAILEDVLVEADETFTVAFGDLSALSVTAGATDTVTVTIDSDDTTAIRFSAATYTAVEGQAVDVGLVLTGPVSSTITIPLVYTDGSAMDGTHYTAISAVTISAGTLTGNVDIQSIDDDMDNTDRMFSIALGPLPTDVTIGGANFVMIVLTDNDDPLPALSVAADPATIAEGAASTITITAATAPADDLTIPFTIGGANITTGDYTLTAGSTTLTDLTGEVTLAGSATEVTLTLTAVDDADVAAETLTFTLDTPGGTAGYTVTTAAATITIDPVVPLTVEFSEATATVEENLGDSDGVGELNVSIELNEAATMELVIPIVTMDVTTMVGEDYEAPSESVTFAIGEMSKNIVITLIDDDLVEDDETFTVSLGTPLPIGVTAGTQTSTTVTITSEDIAVTPMLELSPSAVTVTAGESATLTLNATNGATTTDLLFTYGLSDNSTAGFAGDPEFRYIDPDGNSIGNADNFTLPSGQESWTFMIMAVDDADTMQESADITFRIWLPEFTSQIFTGTFRLTIDPPVAAPLPALSVAAAPTTIAEGAASTITITAATAPAGNLTIPFTIGGANITAADYTLTGATNVTGLTGNVTLATNQTSVELTLTAADDADTDPEMLTFTLDTPGGTAGYTVTTGTATITINPAVDGNGADGAVLCSDGDSHGRCRWRHGSTDSGIKRGGDRGDRGHCQYVWENGKVSW